MSDKIGLVTGSFDPITNGHMAIIEKASQLFDKVYVGLFYNAEKKGLFSLKERQEIVEEAVATFPNVEVIVTSDSLVVDVAKELNVTHLVRGLRDVRDLEYEKSLAFFNHHLSSDLETVFFLASPHMEMISSSRIRELLWFKADISPFVPPAVMKRVMRDEKTKETF